MKTCTKCKNPRPNKDFLFHPASSDALGYHCRECRNADRKALVLRRKLEAESKPTGTNPWAWREYRTSFHETPGRRYT